MWNKILSYVDIHVWLCTSFLTEWIALWVTENALWCIFWRRKWQPTPVLLPGKSHGWKSVVGYSPWGHKESDTTERLHFHFLFIWNSIFKIIKLLLKCSDIAVSCVGACLHCWISSTWHTDESLESSGEWPKLIHFDEFIHLFTHLLKKKIIEDFFYVRQIHVFICLYNTDIKSVP